MKSSSDSRKKSRASTPKTRSRAAIRLCGDGHGWAGVDDDFVVPAEETTATLSASGGSATAAASVPSLRVKFEYNTVLSRSSLDSSHKFDTMR